MKIADISVAFFLQIFFILAVCRGMGWLLKRYFGQPQVMGEMIAGVMLGPSLLGYLAPQFQAAIFPMDARPTLFTAAQLGIGLYMFTVGLRFEKGRLVVVLEDEREVSVPLSHYPTLQRARPAERSEWRSIGRGIGFHWPKLDLDLSVRGIVSGLPEVIPAPPPRPCR